MTVPTFKKLYNDEIVPKLKESLGYKSVMQVPRLIKICVNQGLGAATQDKKLIERGVEELTLITGQKAVPTVAKKSISNFKLREGVVIGCRVTLRNENMYDFMERLIKVALPRVRDFRGIKDKSFDGRGNYSLGITEQIIFPEINMDKISGINGMDITFVTSAKTDAEGYALLEAFGMPFKKPSNN